MNIMYDDDDASTNGDKSNGIGGSERPKKRRRRLDVSNMHRPTTSSENTSSSGLPDLLTISKVMFELRMKKQAEEKLSFAPPPRLSFG